MILEESYCLNININFDLRIPVLRQHQWLIFSSKNLVFGSRSQKPITKSLCFGQFALVFGRPLLIQAKMLLAQT